MKQYTDKETRILDTAADFFAKHPFHKVLLSDVARSASVGKGTLYLYFKSKDDLYFSVLFRAFSTLVDQIRGFLAGNDSSPDKQLAGIIRILVEYFCNKAVNMDMMSTVMTFPSTQEWREKRQELGTLIERIVRKGIEQGIFENSHSRLTAISIAGLIRTMCLFAPEGLDAESIYRQAYDFVLHGIEKQH